MEIEHRGKLVVLRALGGDLLIRRVWSVTSKCIYIMADSEFKKRSKGHHSLDPVGFPPEDVFVYNNETKELIDESSNTNKIPWDRMTPLCPMVTD